MRLMSLTNLREKGGLYAPQDSLIVYTLDTHTVACCTGTP